MNGNKRDLGTLPLWVKIVIAVVLAVILGVGAAFGINALMQPKKQPEISQVERSTQVSSQDKPSAELGGGSNLSGEALLATNQPSVQELKSASGVNAKNKQVSSVNQSKAVAKKSTDQQGDPSKKLSETGVNPEPEPTRPSVDPKPAELKPWYASLLSEEERTAQAFAARSNMVAAADGASAFIASMPSVYGANPNPYKTSLWQLDTKTGKTISKRSLDIQLGFNTFATRIGNTFAVVDGQGALCLVDLAQGSTTRVPADLAGATSTARVSSFTDGGQDFVVWGATKLDSSWAAETTELVAYNLSTKTKQWSVSLQPGMYWSGALYKAGKLFVPTECGKIVSLNARTGAKIAEVQVGAAHFRSQLAALDAQTYVISDYAGNLHKLRLGDDGSITAVSQVNFATKSVSSPAVIDGAIYVGGAADNAGVLAKIDPATLKVIASTKAEAEIQSSPVRGPEGKIYVSVNKTPGVLYAWSGVDNAALVDAFELKPEAQNYNNAQPLVLGKTVVFTNDSGYVMGFEPAA